MQGWLQLSATITFSVCSPQSVIDSLQFTWGMNFPWSFARTLNNKVPLCSFYNSSKIAGQSHWSCTVHQSALWTSYHSYYILTAEKWRAWLVRVFYSSIVLRSALTQICFNYNLLCNNRPTNTVVFKSLHTQAKFMIFFFLLWPFFREYEFTCG